jgi:hypothetical protein
VRLGTISTSTISLGKVTSITGDTTNWWIKHLETDHPRILANHSIMRVLQSTSLMLCGLILSLCFLLLFVFSYLAYVFISVLYMYAFAFSSLSMFSIFLYMQYFPYSLLYVENAVSTAHLLL